MRLHSLVARSNTGLYGYVITNSLFKRWKLYQNLWGSFKRFCVSVLFV